MNRRQYLGVVGAGGFGTLAGCVGILGGACTPGDDPVGEIELDLSGYTESDRYTAHRYDVQGTIVEVASTGIVIDDGTGLAELSVEETGYVFDTDEVDEGDCFGGSGPLYIPWSGQHEVPHIALEEVDHGQSEQPVSPPPERPNQTVSSNYSGLSNELTVTVSGPAEIPSDRLLVRWREYESETPWTEADREWWHEVTDVPPGEPIPDGSQFSRELYGFDYSALWMSDDRGWSRELDQLESGSGF